MQTNLLERVDNFTLIPPDGLCNPRIEIAEPYV